MTSVPTPTAGISRPLAAGDTGREADPLDLVARLEALPVHVESVAARVGAVRVPGYPADCRPSGIVLIEGAGRVGVGECVAWSATGQGRFAKTCATALPPGLSTVAGLAAAIRGVTRDPYERAALEAAVIDLALRQAGANAFDLAGLAPRPVAFVISFGALPDPAPALGRLLEAVPHSRLKLDADPGWPDLVLEQLGEVGRVAILDLKLAGDLELAERAHAALPEALLEDPRLDPRPLGPYDGTLDAVMRAVARGAGPGDLIGPRAAELASPSLSARLAFDQPVRGARDLEALPIRPFAVNVKPTRVGGFLEALRVVAACRRAGVATYVGGMFELGPGRSQAQVLASLTSPGAWNDVAPIPLAPEEVRPASPLEIPTGFAGLGFDDAVRF